MIGGAVRHPAQGPGAAGRPTAGAVLRSPTPPTGAVKSYSGGMRRRLDLAVSLHRVAAGAVPRRADHRPGSAQPHRPVGRAARAGRRRAPRCCSPRSTWRKPISSPTTSWSSTRAASSPRARRCSSSSRRATPAWWSPCHQRRPICRPRAACSAKTGAEVFVDAGRAQLTAAAEGIADMIQGGRLAAATADIERRRHRPVPAQPRRRVPVAHRAPHRRDEKVGRRDR